MYYYISMLLLSLSLLILQSCLLLILFPFKFLLIHSIHFTSSHHRLRKVNVLLHFNASLIILAPESPISLSIHYIPILYSHYSFIIFISSLHRLNLVNVVLHFNASLIILAPSSPILLPIHFIPNDALLSPTWIRPKPPPTTLQIQCGPRSNTNHVTKSSLHLFCHLCSQYVRHRLIIPELEQKKTFTSQTFSHRHFSTSPSFFITLHK